ncbi:MAG TPA: site-2 protease family protein [Candidatus Limnocylindrales bacterium]
MFDTQDLLAKLLVIAVLLLFAFPVHEAAHAWMAYRQGDATAKMFGRITLNPIVHFDTLGALMTVVSVAIGGLVIGWAKPTPINPANLRDRRNGEVIVALAGPISNWLMAIAGAVVFRVMDGLNVAAPTLVYLAIYYFVIFNVVLGIFNLLPVPPLDGSTLLFRFLSPRQVWQIRPVLTQYGIFIMLGVIILLGPFISRIIGEVTRVLLGI